MISKECPRCHMHSQLFHHYRTCTWCGYQKPDRRLFWLMGIAIVVIISVLAFAIF